MVLCCHPLQLLLTTSNSECKIYNGKQPEKKELVSLLYAYKIQTKRYVTKYKAGVHGVQQTQLRYFIFQTV